MTHPDRERFDFWIDAWSHTRGDVLTASAMEICEANESEGGRDKEIRYRARAISRCWLGRQRREHGDPWARWWTHPPRLPVQAGSWVREAVRLAMIPLIFDTPPRRRWMAALIACGALQPTPQIVSGVLQALDPSGAVDDGHDLLWDAVRQQWLRHEDFSLAPNRWSTVRDMIGSEGTRSILDGVRMQMATRPSVRPHKIPVRL